MYLIFETSLEIAKKALILSYLKALSFRNIEKRQNTSNESELPLMCCNKYPYKYLSIKIL